MSKIKQLIAFLIISNLLTLCFLAYSFINKDFQQNNYFIEEIQEPLVELQGMIHDQQENNWKHPELVSFQAYKIQKAIKDVLQERHFAHSKLKEEEKSNLRDINQALQSLPQNTSQTIAIWKKKDKQNALTFEKALVHAKMDTNEEDYKKFMNKCKIIASETSKINDISK
ncbi:hypothetical protein ACIQ4I_04100 [Rummeliibacillus sp. NPDC094406]|uniref:hypothetical protein n=1 Tax=Rummeliibacillus sp. NPDC094406 TaxID=3364511 RepID=UPI00382AE58F